MNVFGSRRWSNPAVFAGALRDVVFVLLDDEDPSIRMKGTSFLAKLVREIGEVEVINRVLLCSAFIRF